MREILKAILLIGLSIVLGVLLLMLAYMIPVQSMEQNCRESVAVFEEEGLAPIDYYSSRALDNFMDTLILETAAYPGKEPLLERAIGSYRLGVLPEDPEHTTFFISGTKTLDPHTSFLTIYGGSAEGKSLARESYTRYWHGYLVTLKPLLAVLNYEQIRSVNLCVQYGLLLVILKLMIEKCRNCLLPFLLTILFLSPTTIGKSLQYSSVYYVTLLPILLLLWKRPSGGKCWKIFLFAGTATAYLDLLTSPILSLTIPLCVLCMLLSERKTCRENMKIVLQCVFAWSLGYAGMWAGKWVLALLFQGRAYWDSLTNSMREWSASGQSTAPAEHGMLARIQALDKVWTHLFAIPHLLCLTVGYAGITALVVLKKRKFLNQWGLADAALFLVPAAIPVLWTLFLSHHSAGHFWFTYRDLAPTVFALLCALSCLESLREKESAAQ